MIKYLIYIGLLVTPFLTIRGMDSRHPKEIFALGVALLIASFGMWRGLKPFPNKWLGLFIVFASMITFFPPKWQGLNLYGGDNVDGTWNYKPLFYLAIFVCALWSISSAYVSEKAINTIMAIMAYGGVAMTLYVLLQWIGIDPLFKISEQESTVHVSSYPLTGTLGHPTIVSVFILMCIPAAYFLKKYAFMALMAVTVLLTQSQVSIAAMVGAFLFYLFPRLNWKTLVCIVLGLIASYVLYKLNMICFSGRIEIWQKAFMDMKDNPITALTGFGIGAYSYIAMPLMHTEDIYWSSLHNEYFQLLWGTGIVGLFLFLKSLEEFHRDALTLINRRDVRCLLTSVVAVLICACGNFVLQLAVFQIYLVVIVGLIYALIKQEGNRNVIY